MAMTANGMIAAIDDSADFLTKEESASYVGMVLSAGNLIIGRRTYEILSTQPEFQEFLKAGVKIVAISHGSFHVKNTDHTVAHSPQEALDLFGKTDTVVIAGGGMTNAAFLNENLVDEIFLDIEPAIIGGGLSLFRGVDFDTKALKLVGVKQFGDNEVQLHYEILRP